MKARLLRKLRIKRVDLVETGANQDAMVTLFKSADGKSECKGCGEQVAMKDGECPERGYEAGKSKEKSAEPAKEKTMEATEKLQKDFEAAMKLAEEESAKRETLEKSLKAQEDAVKKQAETIETLRKGLEDSAEKIRKAEHAARLSEFKKSVDSFEHLPVKGDTFAPILMKCADALDATEYAELDRVLKAADAASAPNFREVGSPGFETRPRSAAEELDAKAEELVTKGIAKAEAMATAMRQNPKLAARQRQESYAAQRQDS